MTKYEKIVQNDYGNDFYSKIWKYFKGMSTRFVTKIYRIVTF